jgi:hypothetical protein
VLFTFFNGAGLWESIAASIAGKSPFPSFDGLALLPNKFIGKWVGSGGPPSASGGASAGFIAGPVAAIGPDFSIGSGSLPHCRTASASVASASITQPGVEEVAALFAPEGQGLVDTLTP